MDTKAIINISNNGKLMVDLINGERMQRVGNYRVTTRGLAQINKLLNDNNVKKISFGNCSFKDILNLISLDLSSESSMHIPIEKYRSNITDN